MQLLLLLPLLLLGGAIVVAVVVVVLFLLDSEYLQHVHQALGLESFTPPLPLLLFSLFFSLLGGGGVSEEQEIRDIDVEVSDKRGNLILPAKQSIRRKSMKQHQSRPLLPLLVLRD
jgi:O-antigen ligase